MSYQPPLDLTLSMLNRITAISEMVGRWSWAGEKSALSPQLRRENRIRTILASLAIENNTLSVEQISAVRASKRVLCFPHEILEDRNAFSAYEAMLQCQSTIRAHRTQSRTLKVIRYDLLSTLIGGAVRAYTKPQRQEMTS